MSMQSFIACKKSPEIREEMLLSTLSPYLKKIIKSTKNYLNN